MINFNQMSVSSHTVFATDAHLEKGQFLHKKPTAKKENI